MTLAAMDGLQSVSRHGGALKLHRGCGSGGASSARLELKNRQKLPVPETGPALAISTLALGVAANLPSSTSRGGARNRSNRESHALTVTQIANLTSAEGHSKAIGLPFTRMQTIHWESAGVPLEGMAKATGRYLDLLTKWLARKGCKTAWLWVHEGGEGKGGHCHLLIHVPAELARELAAKQKGWLRRITGKPYRKRVIHSKPIGGRLGLETGNPDLHAVNLEAALAYVLKGASPEAASQFGLERLEPGGRVIGKRCGTSQNIGAKARKAKD